MQEESKTNYDDAQTNENVEIVQNLLVQNLQVIAEGISPMEELGLQYDKNDQKDINELRDILSKNLSYPSTQVAETHIRANRLGSLDLKKEERGDGSQNQYIMSENAKYCPCCGFVEQENTLTLTTDIKKINHIGLSTYFLFLTMQHLIILLLFMFVIFSGYAIVTNIQVSKMYENSLNGEKVLDLASTYSGVLAMSLGSKAVYYTEFGRYAFAVQCWLGVALVIIWGFLFAVIQYRERTTECNIDTETKTASDYTLVFENMPKDMTKQQLQQQLKQYQNTIKETYISPLSLRDISISKINQAVPFYLDSTSFDNKELKDVNEEYDKCKKKFTQWVKQRQKLPQFTTPEEERQKVYKQFSELNTKKIDLFKTITNEIIEKKKQDKKFIETVPTLVTFHSSHNKEFLNKMHDSQNYKFLFKLPFFDKRNYFHYKLKDGTIANQAIIKPAPQPEDIIWTNLGQSYCSMLQKKLLTFAVTIVILCLSFVIVYAISSFQYQLNLNGLLDKKLNMFINILISIIMTAINMLLSEILQLLTTYERNQTYTYQQASIGLKSCLGTLVNSILTPILVNRFFKYNIYGTSGLAEDVFYFGLTNSLQSPIMKILNTNYFISRILKWYYNKPNSKIPLDQAELNTRSQYSEFHIGFEYIYSVNLFLFTCFFVSLQPILPIFAAIGILLMEWAQKYCLYNRSKRPTPGNYFINEAMFQLIYCGPLFYSIGSFCWCELLGYLPSGKTPNIVAIIISSLILIIPYRQIIKAVRGEYIQPEEIFEQNRIFLPSQYDRLNPTTSKEGIQDFMDYVAEYRKNMKNKKPEQIRHLENVFVHQCGVGHRRHQQLFPSLFGLGKINPKFKEENLLKQLLGGTNNNSMNPLLLGEALMQDQACGRQKRSRFRNQPMHMVVQNWLTTQQAQRSSYGYSNVGSSLTNPLLKLIQQKPEGQTITYDDNRNVNNSGGLNLVFGNFIKSTHSRLYPDPGNQRKRRSSQNFQSNQIPLNLPLNLFGNMLDKDMKKDRRKKHWHDREHRKRNGWDD